MNQITVFSYFLLLNYWEELGKMQNIVTQKHCQPVVWSMEHRSQIYDPMKVNTVSGYLTRSNIASLLTAQTSADHIHPRYTY